MCVRQNSGLRHCERTPEVEKFEEKWVEFVKNTAGAKKRKESSIMENKNEIIEAEYRDRQLYTAGNYG